MNNKIEYFWGLLGKFLPELIYLGTTMVLSRLLTPDDFGVIGVLSIIFMIATSLCDAGLGGSIVKEQHLADKDCSTIFSFNTGISLLLYVLIFLCSGAIESYYAEEGLGTVTRVISLSFVINAFAVVPRALLVKRLQFKQLFLISIEAVVGASIVSIALALLGAKVYAIVAYRLVYSVIVALMSIFYAKYKNFWGFDLDSLKRLLPFGIYTTLSNVIDTVYENLLAALFGKLEGMSTTGYFYQAKKTEETITISLAQTIGNVAFPILSKKSVDKTDFLSETQAISKTIILGLPPLLLLVSSFSTEIITLMYGRQWEAAGPYLSLLMIAGIFMVMENMNRTFIKSLGEGRSLFMVAVIKRSLGIVLLFIGVKLCPSYIVHVYVASAFLGFLTNQAAFAYLTRSSFLRDVARTTRWLIPVVVLFPILHLNHWMTISFVARIAIAVSALMVYFLIICPLLGLNIMAFIRKFFNKKK